MQSGGVFAPLHDWLDKRIEKQQSHGFFRPYTTLLSTQAARPTGIVAERWHLSHQPSAEQFSQQLTLSALYQVIDAQEDMQLKATVLAHFDEIFTTFISSSAIG